MSRAGFGRVQLGRLARMLQFARELTGDYFHLGGEEARGLPVEVRTLAELKEFEIHSSEVLASIARYGYSDSRFGRERDLYQINLQDHNILQSLKRPGEGLGFSPLVLYVLTHELIHVVRFIKFLAPFHQSETDRWQEEQQVHSITRGILSRVPLPDMDAVLQKYRYLADTGASEAGRRRSARRPL